MLVYQRVPGIWIIMDMAEYRWYRWPIEIDGLPIKNVIFHGYVK